MTDLSKYLIVSNGYCEQCGMNFNQKFVKFVCYSPEPCKYGHEQMQPAYTKDKITESANAGKPIEPSGFINNISSGRAFDEYVQKHNQWMDRVYLLREKRKLFKGISLEKKWKERNESESYSGNKSGGKFMQTIIQYRG